MKFYNRRYSILASLLILTLILSGYFNFYKNNLVNLNEIYGTWEDDSEEYLLQIEFNTNQKCVIYYFDKINNIQKILIGTFNLNTNKKPFLLEIKKIKDFNYPLYSIINLNKHGELKIARFSNKWRTRPIDFDSNSFRLKKNNI